MEPTLVRLGREGWPGRSEAADATSASGGTAAIGAGHLDAMPPTFLVAFDLVALMIAFAATRPLAPTVQELLLQSGLLTERLPGLLALPEAANPGDFAALPSLLWLLLVVAPTTVLFTALLGGYRQIVEQSRTQLIASSLISPLLALSIVTLMLFTVKDLSPSRVFVFTFGGLSIVALTGYRLAMWVYQSRQLAAGMYAKQVLVIGQPAAVSVIRDHFRECVSEKQFRLAGWLSVPTTGSKEAASSARVGLPCLARAEDLGDLLIHRPFHEVIAMQSAGDTDWLRKVVDDCDYFRVRLRIVPEALMTGTLRDLRLAFRSEPVRLPEIVLDPPHHESEALFIKRLLDIVGSAALLVLLSPVLLLIAIAIKLTTPHLPVLFPWRVIGLNGHSFTGYKFTTMVADAEAQLGALASRNEMSGPVFKVKDDPRITPFGRFLRKYSLNELPQLWSVLKGDMSLVGPRPAFRHELDRYVLWQKRKLCVKPGMTCLWQISGRNRISDFDEWVRLDLEYIDRWSLLLDFRILVWTVWAVVNGSGW